jgi:hypothetical protein
MKNGQWKKELEKKLETKQILGKVSIIRFFVLCTQENKK